MADAQARKKVHKRFIAFAVTIVLVSLGFFIGPVELFDAFAKTLGFLFTMYVGGQSATDYRIAANGSGP